MDQQAYELNYEFEDTHWWFVGRRKIVFDQIRSCLKMSPQPRILDYGCGTGKTMVDLAARAAVYGVDSSETSLEYCRSRGLENVFQLEKISDARLNNFDLIMMLDVLEHLESEVIALNTLKAKLSPIGHLIITVPAYDFLWGDEDILSHHKRRYTRKQLVKLLQSSGWEIEKATYFNSFLLPVIATVLGIKKFFKKSDHPLESNVASTHFAMNKIFTGILWLESVLIKFVNLPFGASILVVAKPS